MEVVFQPDLLVSCGQRGQVDVIAFQFGQDFTISVLHLDHKLLDQYLILSNQLDPNRSGAYFEEGISYGQLGQFDKALTLINKALAMQPQNGLYLYGRGRVYLLAGEKEKAMQDFNKAAELDNNDAQEYLDWVARNEGSTPSGE